jgi:transcriptional regulator with XRE-family HTH domain
MAARADMDRTHYSAIERGERNPSYGVLLRVSGIFGVELSELQRDAESRRTQGDASCRIDS